MEVMGTEKHLHIPEFHARIMYKQQVGIKQSGEIKPEVGNETPGHGECHKSTRKGVVFGRRLDFDDIARNTERQRPVLDVVLPQIDLNIKSSLLTKDHQKSVYPERIPEKSLGTVILDIHYEKIISNMDIISLWQKLLYLRKTYVLQSITHLCNLTQIHQRYSQLW